MRAVEKEYKLTSETEKAASAIGEIADHNEKIRKKQRMTGYWQTKLTRVTKTKNSGVTASTEIRCGSNR